MNRGLHPWSKQEALLLELVNAEDLLSMVFAIATFAELSLNRPLIPPNKNAAPHGCADESAYSELTRWFRKYQAPTATFFSKKAA